MGVDYADKEREFLDSLAEDTGRDLAGWMAAIRETKLDDRNAIIDWLRQQGFLFARASWLERIYHNGGRPIYFDPAHPGKAPALSPQPPASRQPVLSRDEAPTPGSDRRTVTAPAVSHAAPVPSVPSRVGSGTARPEPVQPGTEDLAPSLDALLAEAKGYRPLAQLILRQIEAAAPDAKFEAADGYVAIMRGETCAGVLTLSAKELRLALAAGLQTLPAPFSRAKFTKTHDNVPASMTHMIILNDARQITPELIAAAGRVISGK
ncbi:MAG: DUF5655 domain-containing protein [Hyphomicrobium sp.]|jgi:hypothetical protein|nr:DUF5655 domain-containing protein [Hyphomicrobium sp.]